MYVAAVIITWLLLSFFAAYLLYRRFAFFRRWAGVWTRGGKKGSIRVTAIAALILSAAVASGIGLAWKTGYLAQLFVNSKAVQNPEFHKKETTYPKDEILVKYKKSEINLKTHEGKTQAASFAHSKSTEKEEDFEFINTSLLKIKDEKTVEQKIAEFEKDPKVEYAEPNYHMYIDSTPNDPYFYKLYGLHNTGQTGGTADADIDAPEAWDIKTGSADVTVAVIDTGVDYKHLDLKDNMWTNSEEKKNNKDDDGNGYVDDIRGWDFYNDDNDPMDDHSHGTHCAGTIGAVGNNNTGVVGVNWNVKIMPIKFLSAWGSGYTSDAVKSVEYATLMGADVMSNSWGGGGYSQSLYNAISAAKDAGILFIAAAGNNGSNNDQFPHYPSNYTLPNVIAVAATDHNDNLTSWSCYGATSVDVGAPGLYIYSTYLNNSYATKSGTSMATPHVAGLAGLILSQDPDLTYSQVKDLILDTGDPKASLSGKTVSGKRINAFSALSSISPAIIIDTPTGLWYNANPVLDVGFVAAAGLDSGLYQVDSFAGDWTPIFSNLTETSYAAEFSISGTIWEGFENGSTHTIYFMATDDEGTIVGDNGSKYSQIRKDETAPSIADDYLYDGTLVHFTKTITFSPGDSLSGVGEVSFCRGSGCDPLGAGQVILPSPYKLNFAVSQDTTICCQAVDSAGNKSSVDEIAVKLRRVDINNNKTVDLPDFSIMMSVWGKETSYSANAFKSDLNAGNVVDLPDFSILMANWAKTDE